MYTDSYETGKKLVALGPFGVLVGSSGEILQ